MAEASGAQGPDQGHSRIYYIKEVNIFRDNATQDNTDITAQNIEQLLVRGGSQQANDEQPEGPDVAADGHLQSDGGGSTKEGILFDLPAPIAQIKERHNKNTYNGNSIHEASSTLAKEKPVGNTYHGNFIFEETARMKIERGAFKDAVDLLQSLPTTLRQQLMMSECYLQIYKDDKALQCIETIQKVMRSCARPNVRDVSDLVNIYIEKKCYVKALIMIQYAYKIFEIDSKPNAAIIGIKNCVYNCAFNILDPMIEIGGRAREIALDVGVKTMHDMLKTLQGIGTADYKVTAYNASCCINDIGTTLLSLSKYQKAIAWFQEGIKVVEAGYGTDSTKHRVYGHLMTNIGIAHSNLGNYSEAEKKHSKALDVFNKVEDWAYTAEKGDFIRLTERNLESARNAVGM